MKGPFIDTPRLEVTVNVFPAPDSKFNGPVTMPPEPAGVMMEKFPAPGLKVTCAVSAELKEMRFEIWPVDSKVTSPHPELKVIAAFAEVVIFPIAVKLQGFGEE